MFFVASKIFWMFAVADQPAADRRASSASCSRADAMRERARASAIAAIILLVGDRPRRRSAFLIARRSKIDFLSRRRTCRRRTGSSSLAARSTARQATARGQTVFDEGERVVEAAILAKRYPDASVVFTGGSGSLTPAVSTEALQARKLMAALGVDPARVTLEERSRNTDENARFTAALVHPEPSQRWLLVTSAFHMPRSMGVFEKAGFNVVAFPVAYRTLGPGSGLLWDFDPARNLRIFEIAMREWVGLAAYWATGRIDHLFPDRGRRRAKSPWLPGAVATSLPADARRSAIRTEGAPRR